MLLSKRATLQIKMTLKYKEKPYYVLLIFELRKIYKEKP